MGSSSSKNCCCSQKCQRFMPTLKFNLKTWLGLFKFVSKENIQLGDIILFNMDSHPQSSSLKHVGVYYGKKKVVHFDGNVSIEGIDTMERNRGKYQILRLKQGINEDAFREKVDVMLNAETTYHYLTNNCIHFALFLLDMEEFYHKIVANVKRIKGNDSEELVEVVQELEPLNMTGQVDQREYNGARPFQNNVLWREIPLNNLS